MHVHELETVDGAIVFDMDPAVVRPSAGGTRMVDDITVAETALLARAMTYKFAVFERRLGGAKAGIRQRLLDTRDETLERYVTEIKPLVESETFFTGADMGTRYADFGVLEDEGPSVFDEIIDGAGFEEVVTGRGVAAAADEWLGGLDGRSVAVEGFGAAGSGVVRAVEAMGGRVVGISTIHGAVATADGLPLERLAEARAEHGDRFVAHLGLDVHRPADLYGLPVDVLVPGARTGSLDAVTAARVQARVVAPVANVPYTADGIEVLRRSGTVALPDFVCNGGAVIAYGTPGGLPAVEVLRRVERLIRERLRVAREARLDPFDAAVATAEAFLATWVDAEHRPSGPALADEPTGLR